MSTINTLEQSFAETLPEMQIEGICEPWRKITFQFAGPTCTEMSEEPNPFLDYRLTMTFQHAPSGKTYRVPGHFAADGKAGETSAKEGSIWRTYFSPDQSGLWTWAIEFVEGQDVAIDLKSSGKRVVPYNGWKGQFEVSSISKQAPLAYQRGRLVHTDSRYLHYLQHREIYIKMGPDSPETYLASPDFDDTISRSKKGPLLTWKPHEQDWRTGDPVWKDNRGKGLIGSLNYLNAVGCNVISFLTYNAGGDGDNVWPYVSRDENFHFDCSKLDQWGIVFDHAQNQNLLLHIKFQETENDDNRHGGKRDIKPTPTALDAGETDRERKVYLRELVSRFGSLLALEWNLGEENTQTFEQQLAMAEYLAEIDPYDHPIVLHTYPNEQDKAYDPFLKVDSPLTGLSLQNSWSSVYDRTLYWVEKSQKYHKHWVICNDEQGPASLGVPPDPDYDGFDGIAQDNGNGYDLNDIRSETLWGNLMAGGAGVQYYFGYKLAENDLVCDDFRSRAMSWKYGQVALQILKDSKFPLADSLPNDSLLNGNSKRDHCLTASGQLWLIYLSRKSPEVELNLPDKKSSYEEIWFDPLNGEQLPIQNTSASEDKPFALVKPKEKSDQDWVVLVRLRK
ncbi:DUF5060 domain-containing protein [Rubinisphaera italica]|uniref:DUF5060 domain-containing protein n=1 Tax=Rubinisphaera italica TaxID=2527969 RepID=UPI0013EF166A|nr:DUF5060 domain-containing protein [Rubinisphaera italica]